MHLEVECYAGRKANERPLRFRLDCCEYTITEILGQCYAPADAFFKVRVNGGAVYVLRCSLEGDWSVE